MGMLTILFSIVVLTMSICYLFSVYAKAQGDEEKYQVFKQAANEIYKRLLLFLIILLVLYCILSWKP